MKNELGFLLEFCGLSQFTLEIEGSQILIINRFCNNYHGKFPIGVQKITSMLTYFLHDCRCREFFVVSITKPIFKQRRKFETLFCQVRILKRCEKRLKWNKVLRLLKMFDPVVQTMVRNSIWHVTNLSFLASIFPSVTSTTQNLAMEN